MENLIITLGGDPSTPAFGGGDGPGSGGGGGGVILPSVVITDDAKFIPGPIGELFFAGGGTALVDGDVQFLNAEPVAADDMFFEIFGDVQRIDVEDVFRWQGIVHGDVALVHFEVNRFVDFVVDGTVGFIHDEGSRDVEYGIRRLEDGVFEDVADIELALRELEGELEIDGGTNLEIEIDFAHRFAEIEWEDVSNSILTVFEGDVELEAEGLNGVDIDLGAGDSFAFVEDSDAITFNAGAGDDVVVFENTDGVLLGGGGDDELEIVQGAVAYNPGAGEDEVLVSGGRSIGFGQDGDVDRFVFDMAAGGQHDLHVDEEDWILIDAGVSGNWDFADLDLASDGQRDGVVVVDDFELALHGDGFVFG